MRGVTEYAVRTFAVAALVLATLITAAVVLTGADGPYRLRLQFENAGQLVAGNVVKVGGADVGVVRDIRLTPRGLAEVEVEIDDDELAPLHRGTGASIRLSSLSSVAGRYIALHPGANDAPAIPGDGTIGTEHTEAPVELDAILSTFDAETRLALQRVAHGTSSVLGDRGRAANRALEALNPALDRMTSVSRELTRRDARLERFLAASSAVVTAIASRRSEVDRAILDTADVADTLEHSGGALEATLRRAPPALRDSGRMLRDLRATLATARPTLELARPAAAPLGRVLRRAAPVARRARPALRDVRALLPDLLAALRSLPALDRAARPAFGETVGALRGAMPIIAAARAYTPDLVGGYFGGFGGTTGGYYDANGHVLRVQPMEFAGSSSSPGLLNALLPGIVRPPGQYTGHVARCPGAGTQRHPDGSNPVQLPEASCDPGQVP